ncbi:hypothetical protein MYK68_14950 [Gordonia sp. PP30]|uniref:hypothetical protein n=1 Tax=Gordonia sp. PP30 TaxID=2935861 RepID=UPI001FFE3172|nr:hypothetical protein [Gordonia sp. PP30]UQE74024.1 hypothetical protein MYK68_14950 [Gordonia sp. PP30]
MSTESIRGTAEAMYRAAHPEDRTGAAIVACRAAARVANPDHAVSFTIGKVADEERSRASEIDEWLDKEWSRIVSGAHP